MIHLISNAALVNSRIKRHPTIHDLPRGLRLQRSSTSKNGRGAGASSSLISSLESIHRARERTGRTTNASTANKRTRAARGKAEGRRERDKEQINIETRGKRVLQGREGNHTRGGKRGHQTSVRLPSNTAAKSLRAEHHQIHKMKPSSTRILLHPHKAGRHCPGAHRNTRKKNGQIMTQKKRHHAKTPTHLFQNPRPMIPTKRGTTAQPRHTKTDDSESPFPPQEP